MCVCVRAIFYPFVCLSYLKEYGDASSWTKIENLADSELPPKPKAFRKGGEVILDMKMENLSHET